MVSSSRSREETRFLALLSKTQDRAANIGGNKKKKTRRTADTDRNDVAEPSAANIDDDESTGEEEVDWRLPKYIETLESWLEDLAHHPQAPDKDVLKEYRMKVDFLRKILETFVESLASHQNVADSNSNSRRNSTQKNESADGRRRSFREESPFPVRHGSAGGISKVVAVPHGPAATSETITKEIHQRMIGRQQQQIRDELFGVDDQETSVFRHRRGRDQSEDQSDLDSLLRAHHADQEKVAEEMLSLTRALKEQAKVAGTIIQKDTQTLEKSNELAERNATKLSVESERLSEARSQFSCRCWIWLLIGTVSITFISMVWVMKLFRKRKEWE